MEMIILGVVAVRMVIGIIIVLPSLVAMGGGGGGGVGVILMVTFVLGNLRLIPCVVSYTRQDNASYTR